MIYQVVSILSESFNTMAEQIRGEAPLESTVTLVETGDDNQQELPTLRLHLRKPEPKKKVQWRQGTVDNEHMNKKKSKCCCQFEKPRAFDESSSEEEDDECDNCHGHVEKKKLPSEGSNDPSSEPEPIDTEGPITPNADPF